MDSGLENPHAFAMNDADRQNAFLTASLYVVIQQIRQFFWVEGMKVQNAVYRNLNGLHTPKDLKIPSRAYEIHL